MNSYYVYILASRYNGTLYIGVTNDLERRIYEHKQNLVDGFTKKYKVHNLVYHEETGEIHVAVAREKILKKLSRLEKIKLIEGMNPEWKDLSLEFQTWIPTEYGEDDRMQDIPPQE